MKNHTYALIIARDVIKTLRDADEISKEGLEANLETLLCFLENTINSHHNMPD